MLPGPMEYLKSHAIAFVAGAVTVIVARMYVKFTCRRTFQTE
jgi:hypothetical protein